MKGEFIMDTRLYPISPEFFNKHIEPLIARQYSLELGGQQESVTIKFLMQFYMCYAQGFPGETYQNVMGIGTRFIFDSTKEARKEYGGIY